MRAKSWGSLLLLLTIGIRFDGALALERTSDPMNITLLVLLLAVLGAGILWLYAYNRKRTAGLP